MRKVILMMILAIASNSAMADWSIIGHTNEGDEMYFRVNPDTRHRHGDRVKMWVLTDYAAVITKASRPYRSMVEQDEYECEEGQYRTLSYVTYPESMGKGGVVFSGDDPSPWQSVVPDSMGEHAFNFACSFHKPL